jgi:hypothetical protein
MLQPFSLYWSHRNKSYKWWSALHISAYCCIPVCPIVLLAIKGYSYKHSCKQNVYMTGAEVQCTWEGVHRVSPFDVLLLSQYKQCAYCYNKQHKQQHAWPEGNKCAKEAWLHLVVSRIYQYNEQDMERVHVTFVWNTWVSSLCCKI